jgi:light-regulated signal transduction histidine kinase (bacteriophytochrome)
LTSDDFVPVGTPVDLDNCAREPIHIPGSIQPRGVLAVVREADFEVRQVSANVADLLARPVEDVLNHHLSSLIGTDQAARVEQVVSLGDLRQHNPIECLIDVAGEPRAFDAILHREPGGVLLVELEVAYGERPFSFPNTYQAVRGSVDELNRAVTLTELYDVTARAVRELTGFDRVMVYRYDENYNGEVVAEAKRDDLNPFLGLHYPSTDIPAQARALYEKNWLRLISDVGYTPSPLMPTIDQEQGEPTDLTHATLRSVSPIHIEYLQNMAVQASMSISLLRHGRLWGLIACHHYAGPHLPPFGTRAAAEFLGSTLSLRLVDQFEDEQLPRRLSAQAVLGKLTAATLDDSESLTAVLLGAPSLLDLVPADGAVVNVGGEYRVLGSVPAPDVVGAVAEWALDTGEEIARTESLSRALPDLDLEPETTSGALAINLPDGPYAIWFRAEVLRSVDWGGDPHNKAIAVSESDGLRLSPRKSFDRWREIVDRCCEPWAPTEVESAEALRRHLVESLYRRTRGALRLAETLQRSLLPSSIPILDGWELSAHYEPAVGGRVGGDWYDAFQLRDGRMIVLIGDVAGHGMTAAGTMAQVRNTLRAYLFTGAAPAEALNLLNDFCVHMVSRAFVTVIVARVDLDSGAVEAACAGHLIPFLAQRGGMAVPAPIRLSPPIGAVGMTYEASAFTIEAGQGLVMYSDGLVERRNEAIDDGINRLAEKLSRADDSTATQIATAMASNETDDDVTIVTLRRP